jgi:NAD(P)-dependent dehydrogenase (short-subunit alcohol dehydrogenase family)
MLSLRARYCLTDITHSMPRGTINSEVHATPFELPGGAQYMTSAQTLPQFMKRYVEPEEVAANVAHLLGPETRFVTKSDWFIDGGWIEGNLTG